ncbi:MAG: VCBS domain-containing protein [Pararhodobacter sp.]|nr:VCBS domain-containing protein [Pararhodobacter sp.]
MANSKGPGDSSVWFTGAGGQFPNRGAFAALKEDGSVVTWGSRTYGADSRAVADQLSGDVTAIYSNGGAFPNGGAFAALKTDGSVVTWGTSAYGGTSGAERVHLDDGVEAIYSTQRAFAALKADGSVITWGHDEWGGDSTAVREHLEGGVETIYSNSHAFAALKTDGSVVTWGDDRWGGDSSSVAEQLTDRVENIYSADAAFAALKSDGSVITWGHGNSGGNSSSVSEYLTSDVETIQTNFMAFAALKADGSVVTWGHRSYGGDSSAVADQLEGDVTGIYSTSLAFAALKEDGSVVTWGNRTYGAGSSAVADELQGDVTGIYSTSRAFAALKEDGSVVTWGPNSWGGDSSAVADQLGGNVATIYATPRAFAALKEDGSVVTWGSRSYGGDSSAVADELASGVIGLASPFGTPSETGLGMAPTAQEPTVQEPTAQEPTGADTGDTVEVDTAPLVISAPAGWSDDGAGGRVNTGGGDVYLGHADGDAALLRVENGNVTVESSGRVIVDGTVFAGSDDDGRALFTGQFEIAPGTLTAEALTPRGDGYSLLNDLIGVDFSQLMISETEVVLAADLVFPAPFSGFSTNGAPLALRVGADGLSFAPGRIGTADWIPDVELSIPGEAGLGLSFKNLGIDYDGINNALYLSGKADLGWDGKVGAQLGALGAGNLTLDLSGERDGSALFQRGDRFLRFSLDDENALEWDIVGELTYSGENGLIRELGFTLDTIEQSFGGRIGAALPFLGQGVVATGEVSGFWNPLAVDSLLFGIDGFSYPLGATGLFLNGGSLGVSGLADRADTPDPVMEYNGSVLYTFGSSAGGMPTPIRGSIDGVFSAEGFSAGFELESRLGYLFGDSAVSGARSFMEQWFGVSGEAFFDFELARLQGDIKAEFAKGALSAALEASMLGSVYTGTAQLDIYQDQSGIQITSVNAAGSINLPVFGSVNGNVRLEYSHDGDLSNDYVAAWTTANVLGQEISIGARLGFDGSFEKLTGDTIELIGSWLLDEEQDIVLLSATWEGDAPDAELVVIRPDGTRLSENDLAAHDDIMIVSEFSSLTSRHVAIRAPENGIWDIEVVGAPGPDHIEYFAAELDPAPVATLSLLGNDALESAATLRLALKNAPGSADIRVFASDTPGLASGTELSLGEIATADGDQILRWHYDDFDPGSYYLHVVVDAAGHLPAIGFAESAIIIGEPALDSGDQVNMAASIVGDNTGTVAEDDPNHQQAGGILAVTDPDEGEDRFAAPDEAELAGNFGSFSFHPETGAWSYDLDNDADAVQALPGGAEVIDSLVVTSLDGTASETITVTIRGSNDPAIITGDSSATLKPGSSADEPASTGGKALLINDRYPVSDDYLALLQHEAGFQVQLAEWNDIKARYEADGGDFLREAGLAPKTEEGAHSGAVMRDGARFVTDDVHYLITWGQMEADVETLDSAWFDDLPVHLGSWDVDRRMLDDIPESIEPHLLPDIEAQVFGQLQILDPDAGEDRFRELEPDMLTGSYGAFDFEPETGFWAYTLDTSTDSLQSLAKSNESFDQLTVSSLDGTASETITVTIRGSGSPDDDHGSAAPILSGLVIDRRGDAMENVEVTFNPNQGEIAKAATDADGVFMFDIVNGMGGSLEAKHDLDDETRMTAPDALEVLRMSVGLEPSFGPATAYDYIAADINRDGQVNAADALEVLRHGVGLESDHAPGWVFIDADTDFSDIGPDNVQYETGVDISGLDAKPGAAFVGILLGSVYEHA